MTDGLTILGNKVTEPGDLETFPTPDHVHHVTLEVTEGTSRCPITGQPDFWACTISYGPAQRCLETKSLKLYLQGFREEGHFAEALADRILTDVAEALDPVWCDVEITFTVRGGCVIKAFAESRSE